MSRQITDFLTVHGITMTAEQVDRNPNMDATDMDHWRCTFRRQRRVFTSYYSMGYGHNGKQPDAADVLDTLASNATSVANTQSFEEWARDLGFDPDSRKAERTYRTIEGQSAKLAKFLEDAAYQDLLWNIERL